MWVSEGESKTGRVGALTATLPERWGRLQRSKNTAIYVAIRLALFALRLFPRPLLRALGHGLGRLAPLVAVKERKRATEQLREAFPELSEAQTRRAVRHMFVSLAVSAVDALILDRVLARTTLPEPIRQLFREALEEGRGVVAVSAHLGHWELCAQSIAAAGFPLSVIASPTYDPRLTRLIHAFRSRNGAQVLWRGDRTVGKDMLRVFKRNEILAMLIDQDTKVQGTFVPFFGRPAYTPVAAAQLALRFQAPIIVGFVFHHAGGYRFAFERFEYDPESSPEALTAALTHRIEAAIREEPTQWVWFHRRWKTQPGGLELESVE